MKIPNALKNAIFMCIIITLLGILLLLFSIYLSEKHAPHIATEILRDLGILSCSIGLISIAYESLIRKQLLEDYNDLIRTVLDPDSRRLGVVHLFRNRAEKHRKGWLPEVLLRAANDEVLCLGLGLVNFIPEEKELIRQKVTQGCRFRFLIYDVEDTEAGALDETLGYANNSLIKYLTPSAGAFVEFHESLLKAGIPRDRFDVRKYKIVPPWGIIATDPKRSSGRLYVEINAHGVEGSACPGFALEKTVDGWFEFFEAQYESIWDKATPLVKDIASQG